MIKKFLSYTMSIEQRSKDPVSREATSAFASLIIALSGAILFLDKVFYFEFDNNFGFKDTQTFIWVFTQSVSPMLLTLGALLRAHKLSYCIPVYFYAIQMIWVFDPTIKLDDALLHVYAIGCVFIFFCLMIFIQFAFRLAFKRRNSQIAFLEEFGDLAIKAGINKKEAKQ
ncbi:hypothetical protein ACFQ1M_09870 [Sungkyunkwania multivorans]|uniref:Uncharacterized protein n=1 Tax=Sungkyunkwania multivorans TaxID=1173618 RepID=A0ABW3CXJ7_9FLAO